MRYRERVPLPRLTMLMVMTLLVGVVFSGGAVPSLDAAPADDPEIKALMRDIKSLNLINGLTMTVPQMKLCAELARQMATFESAEQDLIADRASFVAALSDLRAELRRGAIADREIQRRIGQFKNPAKRRRAENVEAALGLADQAAATLTPGQAKLVETFEACLIAKPSLTDPSMIGSAATKGKTRRLDRLYAMPAPAFAARAEAMAERHVRHLRLKYPGQVDERAETDRALTFFRSVRELDEVDYELKKADLINSFEDSIEEQYRLGKGKHGSKRRRRMIAQFLLNPAMIPVYEERIAAGGPPTAIVPEHMKGPDPVVEEERAQRRLRRDRRRARRRRRNEATRYHGWRRVRYDDGAT